MGSPARGPVSHNGILYDILACHQFNWRPVVCRNKNSYAYQFNAAVESKDQRCMFSSRVQRRQYCKRVMVELHYFKRKPHIPTGIQYCQRHLMKNMIYIYIYIFGNIWCIIYHLQLMRYNYAQTSFLSKCKCYTNSEYTVNAVCVSFKEGPYIYDGNIFQYIYTETINTRAVHRRYRSLPSARYITGYRTL